MVYEKLDYSKWDKIVKDESEKQSNGKKDISVHRFDEPKTITLHDQSCFVSESKGGSTSENSKDCNKNVKNSCSSNNNISNLNETEQSEKKPLILQDGAWVVRSCTLQYGWGQTKLEIVISVLLLPEIRGSEIKFNISENLLVIELPSKQGMIEARFDFPYPVLSEEESWIWEIYNGPISIANDTRNGRWMIITLKKKEIIKGANIRWAKLSKDDPGIEFDKPVGKDFKLIWDEAHRLFLEKREKSCAKIGLDTN